MTDIFLCPHCQAENPAGAQFCSSCGKDTHIPPIANEKSQKKSKVWIWVMAVIGVCVVCVVLIALIFLVYNLTRPKIGSTKIRKIDGMVQVYVPEGEFSMGSYSGDDDEAPVHQVTLDAYWIDQTEVTNEMYQKCMDAGFCGEPQKTSSVTRSSYFNNPTYANYPVVYVTWYDAKDYCEWVGGRLPTEAEWEKAARGDDARDYPWGNSSPTSSIANFGDNVGDTTAVGSYPLGASIYGALDMAGNAYEWVFDRYDPDFYSYSLDLNPAGPSSGEQRVLRGASFNTSASVIRAANRGRYAPDTTGDDDGFRCVFGAELP